MIHSMQAKEDKIITPWMVAEQWINSHKLSKILWKVIRTSASLFFKYTHIYWQSLSHKSRYMRRANKFFMQSCSKHENLIAFVKALIVNPRATGAILPSSKYLAREMAKQVVQTDKLVVELGAGTGIVTEMLLQSGINSNNLIVIEYSRDFVKKLRQRFPNIRVIEGNAVNLCDLLENDKVSTIVSSIPLLSLPRSLTEAILRQIETVLQDKGRYIQFTYDLLQKRKLSLMNSNKIYSKYIWLNIPPARVDVWER